MAAAIDDEAARGAGAPYGAIEALDLPVVGEAGTPQIHLVDLGQADVRAATSS